ncbi:DUF881 domain-containing protein [Rhodococcus sp. D2-41]|uniref:DUF881 domain-containing protein n=1 Tax=Speluncibacter jeojiensis TaxID=2710754 RepID=UPI00240F095F|nr:DUF881 domain-containing protein [Rhodococcus sp. D2-41]MDG3012896.1 DUF881 domain-containing protein [Rhodococcus sp. D2-41]
MRARRAPARSGGPWRYVVPVVCVAAGLLASTTYATSHGNELRAGDSTRLSEMVRQAQSSTDQAARERDQLAGRVEAAQNKAAGSDSRVAHAVEQGRALEAAAGLTPVTGPGLVVTLTDAPRDADGKYPAGASPDDLVIHQQDVQSVLNALWAGGATAIELMDQRVVNTSAPRCIGNTLLLHGRTYSPPYVMRAIGPAGPMQAALDAERGVQILKQYVVRFSLGYKVATDPSIGVPGYAGPLRMKYATPAG